MMTTRKTPARPRGCEEEAVALQVGVESEDVTGRHRRIEEAAYLRAATRGFTGGDPVEDWLLAEAEIDAAEAAGKR